MKNSFDDLIRSGDDVGALRYLADEYYKNGKMGHTRKLLLERVADTMETMQADRESYQQVKKALSREGFDDIETMISRYKQVMIDSNEIDIAKNEEIEQLIAERDAAIDDMEDIVNGKDYCKRCDYYAKCQQANTTMCGNFVWRRP